MNILISEDMGSAYRLNDEFKCLEFAPMMKDGTFSLEEFGPVEPDLVGEERTTFEGVETDLYGVFKTITNRLFDYEMQAMITQYEQWCNDEDLPSMSADELLVQTTGDDVQTVYVANEEQRQWLTNFIKKWEAMEEIARRKV